MVPTPRHQFEQLMWRQVMMVSEALTIIGPRPWFLVEPNTQLTSIDSTYLRAVVGSSHPCRLFSLGCVGPYHWLDTK